MNLEKFCAEWLAAWTGNQPERLRAFYTENAFYSDPAKPKGLTGADILPYFKKLLALNPNWIWETVEILPTPKGFCLKWKATIPVGSKTVYKTVHETGLDIVELSNGKISRNEVYFDRAAILAAMNSV